MTTYNIFSLNGLTYMDLNMIQKEFRGNTECGLKRFIIRCSKSERFMSNIRVVFGTDENIKWEIYRNDGVIVATTILKS